MGFRYGSVVPCGFASCRTVSRGFEFSGNGLERLQRRVQVFDDLGGQHLGLGQVFAVFERAAPEPTGGPGSDLAP